MTRRARIVNSSPVIWSLAVTPMTELWGSEASARRKPVIATRLATWAPWAAAVRASSRVKRASSTWASWYWIAPGEGVGAQAGHEAESGLLRQVFVPRHLTRGLHTEGEAVVERDAAADVEALPGRLLRGYMKGTGRTRWGAMVVSSRRLS